MGCFPPLLAPSRRAFLDQRDEAFWPYVLAIALRSRSERLRLLPTLRTALGAATIAALERTGGVKKEAAAVLGISQRALSYYLGKHAIE
jgi:DNA-binding NtrC family response regulator